MSKLHISISSLHEFWLNYVTCHENTALQVCFNKQTQILGFSCSCLVTSRNSYQMLFNQLFILFEEIIMFFTYFLNNFNSLLGSPSGKALWKPFWWPITFWFELWKLVALLLSDWWHTYSVEANFILSGIYSTNSLGGEGDLT